MARWRPRLADILAVAVLTAGTQAEVWAGLVPGASRPALAASYLVGTAVLIWHRVLPTASLAVSLTALGVVPALLGVHPNAGLSSLAAVMVAVAAAGYRAPRPVLALVLTLALLSATILATYGLGSTELVIPDIAFACLLGTGAWLAGRGIASRTLRAQLAEQRAAHTEREAQWRVESAATAERLQIARELHDVVAHSISVMTLHVSGVRRLLRPDQTAEREALELVERTGRESLAEMHRMLGVLREPHSGQPRPAPGLAQVADLLEPARAAGLEATLTVIGRARPLPAGLELAAYRIVQEAVTNVLRHAAARRLSCTIAYHTDAVELCIVNDGVGLTPPAPGGHGLIGMRERAAVYGGTVEAGPGPQGGYTVRAVLPLYDPATPAERLEHSPDPALVATKGDE